MKLIEVIQNLDEFDADQAIYVTATSADADAVVDYEADDGNAPPSAKGMRYFLEVSIARDSIRVWSQWRDGRQPTADERMQAVLYYAKNDAFMPAN